MYEHYPVFALQNFDIFESPHDFASDVFVEHGGLANVHEEVVIFLGNTSLHIMVYLKVKRKITASYLTLTLSR